MVLFILIVFAHDIVYLIACLTLSLLYDKFVVQFDDVASIILLNHYRLRSSFAPHVNGRGLSHVHLSELIDINKWVSSLLLLLAWIVIPKAFTHNILLCLFTDLEIIKPPPFVVDAVKDECVVVAALGIAVVNKDGVQVVREVFIFLEGAIDFVFLLS